MLRPHEVEEAVAALEALADWLTLMYNESDFTRAEKELLTFNGDSIASIAARLKQSYK